MFYFLHYFAHDSLYLSDKCLSSYLRKYVSGKLPTYPSPNLTLNLTSHFGRNVRFEEGKVGSFPETYIDPKMLYILQGAGNIQILVKTCLRSVNVLNRKSSWLHKRFRPRVFKTRKLPFLGRRRGKGGEMAGS